MKHCKKWVAGALALLLCLSLALPVFAADQTDDPLTQATEAAAKSADRWLGLRNLEPDAYDTWTVIALCRSGYSSIFSIVMEGYQNNLESLVRKNLYLVEKDSDEIAYGLYGPAVMALTAVGKLAHLTSYADMVMGISLQANLDKAGTDGWFYALIAADSGNYEFTEGGDVSREVLLENMLAWQGADGGFRQGRTTGDSDARTTGLALQALAPYTDQAEVAAAIQNALSYLEAQQLPSGGYGQGGVEDFSATAQVIMGLCSLDMPVDAGLYTGALEALLAYQNGSAFSYEIEGSKNQDATAEALLALSAYNRMVRGETRLYDMSDVYGSSHNKLSPGKTMGVKLSMVVLFLITFSLIAFALRARLRTRKWARMGILDETQTYRLSEEEIAARDGDEEARRRLEEAKARLAAQQEAQRKGDLDAALQLDPALDKARRELEEAKARLAAQRKSGKSDDGAAQKQVDDAAARLAAQQNTTQTSAPSDQDEERPQDETH